MRRSSGRLLLAGAVVMAAFLPVGTSLAGDGQHARLKARPFPPNQVRLLPGPLLDAQERDVRYILSLDPDRLVRNFRVNAGLPTQAKPLGGWEAADCELRGHFTGHFLTASALAYAATGDRKINEKADRVVAELAACQQALGTSGYLSAFPEEFFDRLESGKKVWAPYYTLHKIGAGLLDMYRLCGNAQALDVLKKMVSWVKLRTDRLDDARMQAMLAVEHGGMNELLRNLYAVTGDPAHLHLAARFDHHAILDPLAAHRDALRGNHANTNIPKVIGAARAYEQTGDSATREAAIFFWSEIVAKRSYATGGTSNYEYWRTEPSELGGELSMETHENCCTYNMLRLTEHIFSWTLDPAAADYEERALFNGILPTQKPDDGAGLMYYVPMIPGGFKMFGLPDSAYWCCTGTGIESFAKLDAGIYFHTDSAIYVNLFIPSEVRWDEHGVVLEQKTDFPEKDETLLRVTKAPSSPFGIAVRIPSWIVPGEGVLEVNGRPVGDQLHPSSYSIITRAWKAGDSVTLKMPMRLRLESLPGDSSMRAILYGPLVLAGELGTEGMTARMREGFSYPDVDRAFSDEALPPAPRLVIPTADATTWVRRVPGKSLTFKTVNVGKLQDYTLIPFNRLFGQRYAIYWNIAQKAGQEPPTVQSGLPAGVADQAMACDPNSNRTHNFQAYGADTGSTGGEPWVRSRYWLRYDMAVPRGKSATVFCQFAADSQETSFDVLVDGVVLRTESFPPMALGETKEIHASVPAELVSGKDRVAVKLRARDGKRTGRLVKCQIRSGD